MGLAHAQRASLISGMLLQICHAGIYICVLCALQAATAPSVAPSGAASAGRLPSSAADLRSELPVVQPVEYTASHNAAPGALPQRSTAAAAHGLQEHAQAHAGATQPAQPVPHAGHAGLLPPVRIPGQKYQPMQPSSAAGAAMASSSGHAAPVVDTAAAAWASRPATSGPASFQPAQRGGADSPPPRWSLSHSERPEALWQAQSTWPAVSAGGGVSQMLLPNLGSAGSSLTPEMVVAAQQQWPALAGQLQALAASMRGAPSGGGGSCFSGGPTGSAGAAGPTPANTPQHAAAHHTQQHMQTAMAPLLPPAALGGFHMAGMLMPAAMATASGHGCPPAQPPPHWGGPMQAHYLGQAAGPGASMVNPMRGGMPAMMLPPGAMGMGHMGAMGPMGMPMAAMMGMPHPMAPYFMLAPPMAQAQAQMFAQQQAMLYGAHAPHMQQPQAQQQHQLHQQQQQAMAAAVAAAQPQHHTQQRQQQQQPQNHQQPAAAPSGGGRHQKLARSSGGPCMSQCAGSTVTPTTPQPRASRSAQAPAAAAVATQQHAKPATGITSPAVLPPPHLPSTWRQLAGQEALRRAPVMRHGPDASFASECKTESVSVPATARKLKASLASGSGCWDTVTQQVLLIFNVEDSCATEVFSPVLPANVAASL